MQTATITQICQHLQTSDIFSGIDRSIIESLSPAPEWLEVRGGENILVQGEVGEFFYLLVHGRLGVHVSDDEDKLQRVATIQGGEGVGEMSLMSDRPITATVTTLRDSNLVRFSKKTFDDLITNNPSAALSIARNIISRLENSLHGERAPQDLSTIVVCATTSEVDIDLFCEQLTTALKPIGTVKTVRPTDLDNTEFGEHLHQLEDKYDYVILACEDHDSTWRDLCVRQGDKVLLLADASSELREFPSNINPAPDRTDLVLLRDDFKDRVIVADWRQALTFQSVFHIRRTANPDYERLARILTGRANNLILSGGAAHSFAQIGVLKAMEEARIPIDRVCGTSMGSIIAAQYAMGMSYDEMLSENRKVWVEGKPLSDLTFPATALVRGKRLQNLVRESLGEIDIEDLPLSFCCVSTNLTRARAEFHQQGSLWRAVRASGTIPGIGPPLISNGELLVDGGLMSNLPVDLFQKHHAGRVIAVDVGVRGMPPVDKGWDDRVDSGWSLLWRLINPFAKKESLPSLMAILYRTATLGSASGDEEAKNAEIYVSLDLSEHNALDFRLIDEIADSGYEHAKAFIDSTDLSGITRN
jgi:NTE family protein